ncbi:MAG: hypothetical protein NTV51_24940 [Verrucomicrobia bacterium]|nr:hypothetical protein [Verrucomicrobiota bacterium]
MTPLLVIFSVLGSLLCLLVSLDARAENEAESLQPARVPADKNRR